MCAILVPGRDLDAPRTGVIKEGMTREGCQRSGVFIAHGNMLQIFVCLKTATDKKTLYDNWFFARSIFFSLVNLRFQFFLSASLRVPPD